MAKYRIKKSATVDDLEPIVKCDISLIEEFSFGKKLAKDLKVIKSLARKRISELNKKNKK
jgi:hypothetical protein